MNEISQLVTVTAVFYKFVARQTGSSKPALMKEAADYGHYRKASNATAMYRR